MGNYYLGYVVEAHSTYAEVVFGAHDGWRMGSTGDGAPAWPVAQLAVEVPCFDGIWSGDTVRGVSGNTWEVQHVFDNGIAVLDNGSAGYVVTSTNNLSR